MVTGYHSYPTILYKVRQETQRARQDLGGAYHRVLSSSWKLVVRYVPVMELIGYSAPQTPNVSYNALNTCKSN